MLEVDPEGRVLFVRFYFVVKLARSPKLITLSKVIRFSFAWLKSEFYYVIDNKKCF